MVEIILTQEVLKLGSKGDVVRVANGYARNYLFPKRLGIPATKTNKGQIVQMKTASDREAASLKGDAEKMAEILSGLTIKIVARAGDADQLFGSVTSRDIAEQIGEMGYTVDRHKILVDRPIRMVGEHDVKIHLHRDIDIPLKILVYAEGREHQVFGEAADEDAGEPASDFDAAESEAVSAAETAADDPAADEPAGDDAGDQARAGDDAGDQAMNDSEE